MTLAGWIVAACLAALMLLAILFRDRLARMNGYVPAQSQPTPEEPRNGQAKLERGAEHRRRLDALFQLTELNELEVSDVMVHRTNMRSVNADDPVEAVVREILQSPHTRMPLWKGSLDNIVGVVHAKDLLRALNEVGNDFSRLDLMKVAAKPWFVPDTTSLHEQLNAFLRRKAHFAIVVDEYGEVEGLVTLEDIIEEIVGEIADEHDIDIQGVKKEADGSVVVDGTVPIRDLNRALDWNLPDEEATTIAGLVIHETQSIPEEKQAFTFHGKRFIVMKRDKNRIARLRIRPAVEEVLQPPSRAWLLAVFRRDAGSRYHLVGSPGAAGSMASACTPAFSSWASRSLTARWRSTRLLPAKAAETMRTRKWVSPVPSNVPWWLLSAW
jgi:Mg2+/Co2+ transporter CorB